MKENRLYSSFPKERLLMSRDNESASIVQEIKRLKSYYWFGSANAWLVFLGLSPGGSPPERIEDKSNYQSEISFKDKSNHLSTFEDRKGKSGFWEKIRQYARDFFPELPDEDLFKIILAGNLIDKQEGDSSKLTKTEEGRKLLEEGATESFKVLGIVKPKVVICLQEKVYELIYERATLANDEKITTDYLEINSGTKRDLIYKVPVTYLESKDTLWNRWVLTRVPMHPSRSHFCSQDNLRAQFLEPVLLSSKKFLSALVDLEHHKMENH